MRCARCTAPRRREPCLFGPGATIQKAHLESAVSIVDEEKPQPQTSHASTPASESYLSLNREVRAGQLDIDFSTGADRRPIAQRLLATGAASIHIRTLYAATPPEETSIEGDRLLAILQGGAALSSLQGDGHTKLTMADPKGNTQTSTGDKILLTFAAPPAKTAKLVRAKTPASTPPPGGQSGSVPLQSDQLQSAQLQSLEQTGHVTVVQTSAASAAAPSTHDHCDRAARDLRRRDPTRPALRRPAGGRSARPGTRWGTDRGDH